MPEATSGTNSSQTPETPICRIGCSRPSQSLKSPFTRTPRAWGAHTANDVPGTSFNSPDLAERIVKSTVAMLAVMWAFEGWSYLALSAGEIRDPARNLPRALLWGTVLTTLAVPAFYVLIQGLSERFGGDKPPATPPATTETGAASA